MTATTTPPAIPGTAVAPSASGLPHNAPLHTALRAMQTATREHFANPAIYAPSQSPGNNVESRYYGNTFSGPSGFELHLEHRAVENRLPPERLTAIQEAGYQPEHFAAHYHAYDELHRHQRAEPFYHATQKGEHLATIPLSRMRGTVYLANDPESAARGWRGGSGDRPHDIYFKEQYDSRTSPYEKYELKPTGAHRGYDRPGSRVLKVRNNGMKIIGQDVPEHPLSDEERPKYEQFVQGLRQRAMQIEDPKVRDAALKLVKQHEMDWNGHVNAAPFLMKWETAEETPTQKAVKALGYNGAKVLDEAGVSTAMYDPDAIKPGPAVVSLLRSHARMDEVTALLEAAADQATFDRLWQERQLLAKSIAEWQDEEPLAPERAADILKAVAAKLPPAYRHSYLRHDGAGHRYVRVVHPGMPHGSDMQQEYAQPAFRTDVKGHVAFNQRGHQPHPRHPHTLLPLAVSDQSQHDIDTLHRLGEHAAGATLRDGAAEGFLDRLPTAEEVPLFGAPASSDLLMHYLAVRTLSRAAVRAAGVNGAHVPAALSWQRQRDAVTRQYEEETGRHPEVDLIEGDHARLSLLPAMLRGVDDVSRWTKDELFPLAGINCHLQCDRSLLPTDYDAHPIDREMADSCETLGLAFPVDSVSSRTYRRVWLQLAADLRREETPSVPRLWGLTGAECDANLRRLVSASEERETVRSLGQTYGEWGARNLRGTRHPVPPDLLNVRIIDSYRSLRPVWSAPLARLFPVLTAGTLAPDTIVDPSGLSHASLLPFGAACGLDQALFLTVGAPDEEEDIRLVFPAAVFEADGALALPAHRLILTHDAHLAQQREAYRASKNNRAVVHFSGGLRPAMLRGAWDDVRERFADLAPAALVVPHPLTVADATHLILSPSLSPAAVRAVEKLVALSYPTLVVHTGRYRSLFPIM